MSKLIIHGGNRLNGKVEVHGSKNSSLPILAAVLLCNGVCTIHNCPNLTDVDAAIKILRCLGCEVSRSEDMVTVDPTGISRIDIPDELMREMRSSVIFLGAILSRMGRAKISFPGGCELGPRPIDLHLKALRQLGATIIEDGCEITCRTNGRLKGTKIQFSFPSVGATENAMIAAATAEGTTVITNAAREPEICDLAEFLNSCGAKISGHGCGTIYIEGVDSLSSCSHEVIPDRITAATYMAAAAITQGDVTLTHIIPEHLYPLIPVFEEAGCEINIFDDSLRIKAPKQLKPVKHVRTMPYPGFPTDAQAIIMSMTTVSSGTSMFVENIFDNRYKHVGELMRLGADIKIEGRAAIVEGVESLTGSSVEAMDLRGAAALIVAGLVARGETVVCGLNYLDRGYDKFVEKLCFLGADIERKDV